MLIEPITLSNINSLPIDYYEFFHNAWYLYYNMLIWDEYFLFEIYEEYERLLVFKSLFVRN